MKRTYWIRTADTQKPSSSLTFVVVAFSITMIWWIVSIFSHPLGLTILPFSASEAMMVLSPILMLYFGRRHTDVKSDEVQLKHTKEKTVGKATSHPDVHPDDIGGEAD